METKLPIPYCSSTFVVQLQPKQNISENCPASLWDDSSWRGLGPQFAKETCKWNPNANPTRVTHLWEKQKCLQRAVFFCNQCFGLLAAEKRSAECAIEVKSSHIMQRIFKQDLHVARSGHRCEQWRQNNQNQRREVWVSRTNGGQCRKVDLRLTS